MELEQLVQKILQMALRGVYRSDIMQSGLGSQKELAAAIKEAKGRGMYSVPDMASWRGTYYQFN